MSGRLNIINRSAEKTEAWVRDLAGELDHADPQEAFRILRAFLHTLRDRLTVEESAQLAAQLPTFLRGVYYEGYVPARVPLRYHGVEEFLDRFRDAALLHGETEASYAAASSMKVLCRHVSAGEITDVLATLPVPIRGLLECGDA